MGMAERIRAHLLRHADGEGFAARLGVFGVKISGCPNSCGQHHVGDIGLTGHVVTEDDGVQRPYYSILVGGSVGEGRGRIGKRLGRYREEDASAAVAALARFFEKERTTGERFPGLRRPRRHAAPHRRREGRHRNGGVSAEGDAPPDDGAARYYRGTITRVYYGSETGVIRSNESGREYRFKVPLVEIRGPIPRGQRPPRGHGGRLRRRLDLERPRRDRRPRRRVAAQRGRDVRKSTSRPSISPTSTNRIAM
jgi:hypothetical protein